MLRKLYSKRQASETKDLIFELSTDVRGRFIISCRNFLKEENFPEMIEEVERILLEEYGLLDRRERRGIYQPEGNRALEHFSCCSTEKTLDFIEACFWTRVLRSEQVANQLVSRVNLIFEEESIGYQLTPMQHTEAPPLTEAELAQSSPWARAGTRFDIIHPQILLISDRQEHAQVIQPALEFLRDRRFRVANQEMLDAHGKLRSGDLDGAITSCSAAFESVLKTICHLKGWSFEPDRDTLSKLVQICKDKELFPGFYAPIFEAVGTVRNKLSDSHGRAPVPLYKVNRSYVDHFFHFTSSHILLLSKLI